MTSAIPFDQKRSVPCPGSGWLGAQALSGGVHQFEGAAGVVADEPAVALDDVAANDHRLDVGGTRSEDHDGNRVAESVQVRGSHVDDRDIGLLAATEMRTRRRWAPVFRTVEEKLEHVAAGHGVVLLPLSTAVFYTRPDVTYSYVSDIPSNQVCLAWDATRRSRLIQDFAAVAANHPPVASRAEPDRVSPSQPQTSPQIPAQAASQPVQPAG